jgi:hypothetical protein
MVTENLKKAHDFSTLLVFKIAFWLYVEPTQKAIIKIERLKTSAIGDFQ